MNRFPSTRHLGRIEGLHIHTPAKAPLHRRRWVWFYVAAALVATIAGFIGGPL